MRFTRLIFQDNASTNGPDLDRPIINEHVLSALELLALNTFSIGTRFLQAFADPRVAFGGSKLVKVDHRSRLN